MQHVALWVCLPLPSDEHCPHFWTVRLSLQSWLSIIQQCCRQLRQAKRQRTAALGGRLSQLSHMRSSINSTTDLQPYHPLPLLCSGALEYNPAGLNRTWFFPQPAKGQLPGDHWHAIYAASFKPTGTPFPLAWAPEDENVPGVDVTRAYIDAGDIPPAAEAAGTADSSARAEGTAEQ